MKGEPPISMRDRLGEDYRWTPRQRDVLSLLAAGKSNGEIAEILGISLPGAKWHVREILSKLNASSREEAAEYWRHHNGLAPRFGRIFRGLARVSLPKLAVGGALTGVIAVSVAVVLSQSGSDGGGMFAVGDDEGGEVVPVIRPTDAPELPAFNPWVNDNGEFWVPRYDDRQELPEGEEPLLDPRWPAFHACMEATGHKLVGQSEMFTQEHLDILLARVHEAMPDRVANKRTPPSQLTGIAGDFVACADEELTRPLAP